MINKTPIREIDKIATSTFEVGQKPFKNLRNFASTVLSVQYKLFERRRLLKLY